MRKKAISLALALVMCLGLMAVPASAVEWAGDFTVHGDTVVQYYGGGGAVTVPSGYTTLGSTFWKCKNVTSVTIPEGFTTIGNSAFYNCTSLTSVTIPSSVTSIGRHAFVNCPSLTDIYYAGSEEQWNAIEISQGNDGLDTATIHYSGASQPEQPTQPEQPATPVTAMPTNDRLEVNGAAAEPTVYKIGGANYFKIRDLAALLNGTEKQFSVNYDSALSAVTVATGEGYAKLDTDLAGAAAGGDQTAIPSNDTIYINGEKADAEVYKIGGANYFKLRDLGKALDFYVGWTAERGMYIETGKTYSE